MNDAANDGVVDRVKNQAKGQARTVQERFALNGCVAMITGGGGMLALMHAAAVVECGGIPVLADVRPDRAEANAQRVRETTGGQALAVDMDVTREDRITAAVQEVEARLGPIGILINNAANDPKVDAAGADPSFGRVERFPLDQWNADLAVGLTGAFLCARVIGGAMAVRRSGVILNISSDLGVIAPDNRLYRDPSLPASQQPVKPISYCVAKGALITLTRYLATYWADSGVRVNALCPGGVRTNQPDDFLDRISQLVPLGRMAEPDEYKAAVAFLVSDASSYMTGACIVIDGGRSIW